jgi:hypothetical protein
MVVLCDLGRVAAAMEWPDAVTVINATALCDILRDNILKSAKVRGA